MKNRTVSWVGIVQVCLLGCWLGVGCSSDPSALEEETDAVSNSPAPDTVEEDEDVPLEPAMSYILVSGEEETVVVSNIGIRCVQNKPGQLYLTGTYLNETQVTVGLGLKVGSPTDDGAQMEIVGVLEGQDAPEGQVLVALYGELDEEKSEEAGGWVSFTSLDPCEGEFGVEVVTESGENIVLKEGVFSAPFELP